MKPHNSDEAKKSQEAIAALPGLGPASSRMLIEAGISNVGELRRLGVENTYRLLRFRHGQRVTTNFIYALDTALRGISWTDLEPDRKVELRDIALCIAKEMKNRA